MNYSTYLPSKKLIYLIAGIGAAGLLLFILPIIRPDSKNQKLTRELTQEAQKEAQKDSDQDGLKDWEEMLWKTDPQNPDTDKDGTTDNEEIKQNRDPLKPGPDDKLPDLGVRLPNENINLNPQDYSAINLTRQMAKTLGFQVLIGAENKDFTVPADSKLLNPAAEKTLAEFTALFHPQISENELIAIDNDSEESKVLYLQLFKKTIELPFPKLSQEEAFARAVQDKNFSGAEEYINYYQKIIQELKAIPTPKTVLSHHKRTVELLLAKITVLENLKEIERDPLKTIIALQEHEKINEEIQQLMNNFGNLFK